MKNINFNDIIVITNILWMGGKMVYNHEFDANSFNACCGWISALILNQGIKKIK